MDQSDIFYIHSQFPWASEATLKLILMNMTTDDTIILREVQRIKQELDANGINRETKSLKKAFQKSIQNTADVAKSTLNTIARDIDPMEATAELLKTTHEAIGAGADIIEDGSDLIKKGASKLGTGKAGKIAKFLGTAVGVAGDAVEFASKGVGAMGAGAVVLGKAISDYDTTMRSMIDMGATSVNLKDFTDLRTASSKLGMSILELSSGIGDSLPMLTNVTGSTLSAQSSMADFVHSLRFGPEAIQTFGYSLPEFFGRIAEETDMLMRINKGVELDNKTKQNIISAFETSTRIATGLAEINGIRRSELLAEREKHAKDVDFETQMRLNANAIQQQYGENSLETFRQHYIGTQALFSLLGETLGPRLQDVYKNAMSNMRFDMSAMDDLARDDELMQALNILSPEIATDIIRILEDGITGADQVTQDEMALRIMNIRKKIAAETGENIYGVTDGIQALKNALISEATQLEVTSATLSDDEKQQILDSASQAADSADTAITLVDNARVTMRNVINTITPGYNNLQTGLDIFETGLKVTIGTITALLPDSVKRPENMARNLLEREAKKQELAQEQIEYHEILKLDLDTAINENMSEATIAHRRWLLEQFEEQVNIAEQERIVNLEYSVSPMGTEVIIKDPSTNTVRTVNPHKGTSVTMYEDGRIIREVDDADRINVRSSPMPETSSDIVTGIYQQSKTQSDALVNADVESETAVSFSDTQPQVEVKVEDVEPQANVVTPEPAIKIETPTPEVTTETPKPPQQTKVTPTPAPAPAPTPAPAPAPKPEMQLELPETKSDIVTGFFGKPRTLSSLLDGIGKGEGTYTASNRGSVETGQIEGTKRRTVREGETFGKLRSLDEMTIGEIKEYQSLGKWDPNRLFAVGKYQIIPETMLLAQEYTGLSDDTVFSPEVQDKMATSLIFKKRPMLGAFIKGESWRGKQVSLEEAMLSMSKEWASFPVPETITKSNGAVRQKGQSYYGSGGNKASHSIEETIQLLLQAREDYKAANQPKLPQIDPQAATIVPENTVAGYNRSTVEEYIRRSEELDSAIYSSLRQANSIINSNNLRNHA